MSTLRITNDVFGQLACSCIKFGKANNKIMLNEYHNNSVTSASKVTKVGKVAFDLIEHSDCVDESASDERLPIPNELRLGLQFNW